MRPLYLKERILVCAVIREEYIGLRTVSRARKSPHRFYIPIYSLKELEYKSGIIVQDIRSFAVLRRNAHAGTMEIEFTWLGNDGDDVSGYQEIVTLPYDDLMEGVRESVRKGEPVTWRALSIDDSGRHPRLIFKSRKNLKAVLENGIIRRKLVRTLRDQFQWKSSEQIEFYDDFVPYSFGFREIRNGETAIVGGLILHGRDDIRNAYYSMHT